MKLSYFAFIPLAIISLGACQTTGETIDRVQKVPVFVTIPDEILNRCPDAPIVNQEDLVTETDYNEKFVLPLWEAHDKCQKVINNVITINEDAKRRNAERENNEE
jgi:hypothetical protein